MQNYPTVDPEGENVETNNNILNLLLILLANHNFKLSTRILLRKMFTTQYESIQYINIVLDYWYATAYRAMYLYGQEVNRKCERVFLFIYTRTTTLMSAVQAPNENTCFVYTET